MAWRVPVSVWSALPGAGHRSRAVAAECALHFLSFRDRAQWDRHRSIISDIIRDRCRVSGTQHHDLPGYVAVV